MKSRATAFLTACDGRLINDATAGGLDSHGSHATERHARGRADT
ncbi:hypothetical protein ACFW19_16125 [Streptomyces nigra]